MTQSGYIPFPRELFADGHWADEREYTKAEALFYIFAKAAYKAGRPIVAGKPVDVLPGQFPASVRYLMQAWKWSNTKVENFLAELQENDTIIVEKTTGQNIITVLFLTTYYNEISEKTTQKRQQNDAETTQKRQQNDEIEKGNKVIKKKEGATPAPLFDSNIENGQSEVVPGSSAFDLLKRIGKPAAQIWATVRGEELFGEKSEIALEWMEVRCKMGRPFVTHQEFTALAKLFASHTVAELRTLIEYSAGKYPDLYPDRLKKPQKGHRAEVIQKNRFKDLQADESGLVKFD